MKATKTLATTALLTVLAAGGTAQAKEITLQMTSVWPEGINLIDSDKHFVELVNQIGEGSIKINFTPGGVLVPATQVFGAVQSGAIDMATDWPGYWAGTDTAFSLLGSFPMFLGGPDMILWINEWGGREILEKTYGKYGMTYLPIAIFSAESGLRANKPLPDLAALDGAKIRMSGRPQGKILEELGAAHVTLPGSDVYQALERGVVDAAEFSVPSTDLGMGFDEVTSYLMAPGWHQPGSMNGLMISQRSWDRLDDKQKAILEVAAKANMLWTIGHYERTSAEAVHAFADAGTEVGLLGNDALDELQELANKVLMSEACDNPLYAEIAVSQLTFMQDYADWRELQGEFAMGRNMSSYPDLEALKACAAG